MYILSVVQYTYVHNIYIYIRMRVKWFIHEFDRVENYVCKLQSIYGIYIYFMYICDQ